MNSVMKQKRGFWLLRSVLCGIIIFAGLSFAAAELTERSVLPMEAAVPALLIALSLAALFAGALNRGAGKRGLLTGVSLAVLFLMGKLVFHLEAFFTSGTLLGAFLIVISAWLGSCIFHKKRGKYTNRNRRNQGRNYK